MFRTAAALLIAAIVSGTPALAQAQETPETPSKPNFVVMLIDDAAFMDLGVYGGEARTPNIDALAARGALLTHYYTSPLCFDPRSGRRDAGVWIVLPKSGIPIVHRVPVNPCAAYAKELLERQVRESVTQERAVLRAARTFRIVQPNAKAPYFDRVHLQRRPSVILCHGVSFA